MSVAVVHVEIDFSPLQWILWVLFVLGIGIMAGRVLAVSRGIVCVLGSGSTGDVVLEGRAQRYNGLHAMYDVFAMS